MPAPRSRHRAILYHPFSLPPLQRRVKGGRSEVMGLRAGLTPFPFIQFKSFQFINLQRLLDKNTLRTGYTLKRVC